MSDIPLKRLLNYNLLFWLSISVLEHLPHYFSAWLFKSEPLSLNIAALLFKELPALLVLALTHYFIRWSYQRPLSQHQLLLGLSGLTLLFIPLNNLTWHFLKTQQPSLQDLAIQPAGYQQPAVFYLGILLSVVLAVATAAATAATKRPAASAITAA